MSEHNRAVWTAVSRRQALLGLGTLAAGGSSLALGLAEQSAASVSVDSFSVSNATLTSEEADPVVDLEVAFAYDAGSEPVQDLVFELLVGDSVVASEELTTGKTAYEGSTSISGRVVDADGWALSDFAPDVASSVTRDIEVGVRFAVLDGSGAVIVEDTATDTTTVEVSHPQEVTLVATVGGDGTISDASST